MCCSGLWTEELLTKYRVLQRASVNVDDASEESCQEEVLMLTAKSHGLYWLFVPGFAILTKMATYLNEFPTFFVIGKELEECERVSEKLPRIEYKLCDDAEQAAKFAADFKGALSSRTSAFCSLAR